MSKVYIKRLDSLSHNDSTATKLINDNFAALQKGIEDSLSRTGKTPNFMDTDLDMNSRRVINTGAPIDDTDAVNYGTYKKHIEEAKTAAANALNSEKRAAASTQESLEHASNAKAFAVSAEESAIESKQAAEEVKETVETGKEVLNGIITDGIRDLDNIVNEGVIEISDTIDTGKEDLNQIIEDGKTDLDEAAGNYYTKSEADSRFAYESTAVKKASVQTYAKNATNAFNITWDNIYTVVEDKGDFKYAYRSLMANVNANSNARPYPVYNACQVVFSIEDALSGNFAPEAELERIENSDTQTHYYYITVYSKEITQPKATVILF